MSSGPLEYDLLPAAHGHDVPRFSDIHPAADACISKDARRFANLSSIRVDPAIRRSDKGFDFEKPFPLFYGNPMLGNICAKVSPYYWEKELRGIVVDITASKSRHVTPGKVFARVCAVAPDAHREGLRIAAAIGEKPFETPLSPELKHLRKVFEDGGIIAAPTVEKAIESLNAEAPAVANSHTKLKS